MSALPINRRRLLTIAAAAAGMPLVMAVSARRSVPTYEWRGAALGAEAQILFVHPDESRVASVMAQCMAEIARLESIFSLFRGDSELSRLNRDGFLDAPSLDILAVLRESDRIGRLSAGAFDVTVQPLWQLYVRAFAARSGQARPPSSRELAAVLGLVDYRLLDIAPQRIAFARRGMAATLNGIAQGYITDRIADLLRDAGFENVLVEVGEISAIGHSGSGAPWRLAIPDPLAPAIKTARLSIADEAAATSSGLAGRFDAAGRYNHLFDPATGASPQRCRSATVVAARAMTADALSTTLSIAPTEAAADILRAAGGRSALLVMPGGELHRFEAG